MAVGGGRVPAARSPQDINSVAVAPNDKLLATGSQDRTARLWALPQCQLLGVFSGHRRGLWCVQFSPMDQVLATASADGTVKLWALQDFSCLKVHTCPWAGLPPPHTGSHPLPTHTDL